MRKYSILLLLLVFAIKASLGQIQNVFHIKFNFQSDKNSVNLEREKEYFEVWMNEMYQASILQEGAEQHYIYNDQDSTHYIRLYNESKEYLQVGSESEFDYKMNYVKIDYSSKEIKNIAGYQCKLAKINLELPVEVGDKTLYMWYTEEIPTFHTPTFPFLKRLPGAALSILFEGEGMEAYKIEKISKPISFFEIPEGYTNMTEEAAEETNYLGDDRWYYKDEETELYGIIDEEDRKVTNALYTSITPYISAVAIVTNSDGKFAAIDTSGNLVFPFKYDYLSYEPDGNQYLFQDKGKFGLIKDDKIIIPAEYDDLQYIIDGYAVFAKNNRYGIIDNNNKIIVPAKYENILGHRSDLFVVEVNEKYNLYSLKNQKLIASDFDYLTIPIDGELITAQKDGKYGFINKKGKIVIPYQYAYASLFYDGKAYVAYYEGLEDLHIIDMKGKKIIE